MERLEALNKGHWLDFAQNASPKCPHCGKDFSIRDHEAWHLYSEDGPHEVECGSCDMTFSVSSNATWTFSTDEQDED